MFDSLRPTMFIAAASLIISGCDHDPARDAGVTPVAPGQTPDDQHDHIELTPELQQQLRITLATAGRGSIEVTTAFPGEVILDPNRMAHVVPRAAGIVREVRKSLGDYVQTDELIAWIESDELAEAKLAFYAKHAELGCCQVELPRAQEIFENTNRLLALLEQAPAAEELRELDSLEMGAHRGKLVTAYAEYLATERSFERERDLFGKNISSESDFVAAEVAFRKAQAGFEAAKDVARYQVQVGYSEAARRRQVAEFEAVAAEQRLRLKGVGDDVLSRLLSLVPRTTSLEPCLCDDPQCEHRSIPSVIEALGDEERLGWYALRAPFAGFMTEKHLTLGEKVDGEESVITIADTSSVWVRFNVYQKDVPLVKPGQAVHIELGTGMPNMTGTITYLAPILDRGTRTTPARVELANPDGVIRPGLYATVHVNVEPVAGMVVVQKDAVQIVEERDVVFVPDGDGFRPLPVELGVSDQERVIVLAGLTPGQRYVERGAFELKSKITTPGTGAHAGHGH